jgi:hypothetical protein
VATRFHRAQGIEDGLTGHGPGGRDPDTRCPYAFDRCRVEEPRLREVAPGQRVACHLR